ncbi:hypothetical protein [Methylobacterium sp. J-090]|uniref:hypothetical protein n=1 Tax=Methylobacterium sp. J-090 TaxID=2836666 RepID=UPI001FBBE47B|nr:hypothetical protein [Methylobacterium sp. J-090]MCJ2079849.1 hypothetical protein [Methylobacterium sp. J-090]
MSLLALPAGPDRGSVIHLSGMRDTGTSQALVLYEPEAMQECDGARTLRLVERAVDAMQELRERADLISAQSQDLIRLTQGERLQMRAQLKSALEETATYRQQVQEAKQALAEATLRIREAELSRREAELQAHKTLARAVNAETRTRSLELYLKKISSFLQERLV